MWVCVGVGVCVGVCGCMFMRVWVWFICVRLHQCVHML